MEVKVYWGKCNLLLFYSAVVYTSCHSIGESTFYILLAFTSCHFTHLAFHLQVAILSSVTKLSLQLKKKTKLLQMKTVGILKACGT